MDRLNHTDRHMKAALERYHIESSFVPPNILREFAKSLEAEIGTESRRYEVYRMVCHFALEFFLPKSPNPVVWWRELQDEWGKWLTDELALSPSTIKHIKVSLNKFMAFLHMRNPDIPDLKFNPVGRSKIREIRSQRELEGKGLRKYISEADYVAIIEHASQQLRPYIELAYKYGLRRNELRALDQNKVRNGYLLVDRQRTPSGSLKLPKYGKSRKVNHWFATTMEAHKLIGELTPIKCEDLSHEFTGLTKELFDKGIICNHYVLHDCRHSWCSNAVKEHNINDVMRAAGHSDMRTTAGYLKDTRSLDDEAFVPDGRLA